VSTAESPNCTTPGCPECPLNQPQTYFLKVYPIFFLHISTIDVQGNIFECFSFYTLSKNFLGCFSNPFKECEKKEVFHSSAVAID
jgi:hypothetical protein